MPWKEKVLAAPFPFCCSSLLSIYLLEIFFYLLFSVKCNLISNIRVMLILYKWDVFYVKIQVESRCSS